MDKFEYKMIIINCKATTKRTENEIEEVCNKYGEEGWELVNFQVYDLATKVGLAFKRIKK